MPIFYVYLHNKVDSRDDDVYKCRASSPQVAKRMARNSKGDRFNIGRTFRPKEFRKRHRDWYDLISGWEPEEVE